MNHIITRLLLILVLLCISLPLQAQKNETLIKSTEASIGQTVIEALNQGAAQLSSITIGTVTLGTIEASVSKFFQFSPSLSDSVGSFLKNFIMPLADTNRAEYAGLYTHFHFGGNLSGFEQNLGLYPNIQNVRARSELQTNTTEFRTITLGLTTDTPILFPFFRSRKKAQATGFRWGMNLDVQITDGRLLGTSDAARYRLGNGETVSTTAIVRHGGFLSLASLGFTPSLRYAFASGLSLQAGLRLGLTFSSRWTIEDSVFVPSSGALLLETNAGRRSETFTGNQISGFSINPLALMVGLGYTIAADRSFHLRPEFVLNIPFGNASWWNRTSLRAGLSVLLNTEKFYPTPDTTFIRDTTIIITASNEAPRTVLLTQNSIVQPSAYPNDEPAKVFVSESYQRRIPKPKPLLSASVDAEFILPNGQKRRTVTVESEKTALTIVPLFPTDSTPIPAHHHFERIREYLLPLGIRLKSFQSSTQSTTTVFTDTLFLAGALPHIVFTPRIVSEVDIRGFDLSLWRTSEPKNQSNMALEHQIALFRDTSSTLVPRPLLWRAAEVPELFLRPGERITYRFQVFDEDLASIPVDSGFISLRSENRISLAQQIVRKNITLYAFSPTLYALYEGQPHIFKGIIPTEPRKIRVFSSPEYCGNPLHKTDTERFIAVLQRMIPSAHIEVSPCFDVPSVLVRKRENEVAQGTIKQDISYLFLWVE